MISVEAALLTVDDGMVGDRYRSKGSRARQVTLIEAEGLSAIAAYMGLEAIAPQQLRRNVVVAGINLLALKDRRFSLGGAVLEMTGECHPCSKLEILVGAGAYNAARGHGGITARVIESGEVRLGDELTRLALLA
jgi:MOSC domain-containing protein YiiM